MTWFERLTGFGEVSPDQVRENITVEGDTLTSLVNGRTFTWGRLETPSLGELRQCVGGSRRATGKLTLEEVVADNADQPGILVDGAALTVTHSAVPGGWPGLGNVARDPMLVDPASGDYHLRFGSPCIDAGIAATVDSDFEGDLRPFDGDGIAECDMGADEWVGDIHEAYLPLTIKMP
jgi:hypothetical protein